jgi:Uma2 family endonuclease
MVVAIRPLSERYPRYAGLRMSADEYLALDDDGFRYELIDGVVVMAPSPEVPHQDVRGEIELQLRQHIKRRQSGWAVSEVDIRLGPRLVYRPDLVFVSSSQHARRPRRIDFVPSLVVEVISPSSVAFDVQTKAGDYAKFGVLEYWIVNPEDGEVRFLRLRRGRYAEVKPVRDQFVSKAVPGFTLDLKAVREASEAGQGG